MTAMPLLYSLALSRFPVATAEVVDSTVVLAKLAVLNEFEAEALVKALDASVASE